MSEHPESLKEINSVEVTEDIKSFVNEISKEIEEEKNQRGEWEQRVDEWYKKRYGIRNKKIHPWPGAANFVIPIIDADIQRFKPAYVNLAYGVSPIVTFEPFGAEDIEPARKREMVFDWRMRTRVEFFNPYCIGIDKMLEKGFIVFKVIWRYETNRYTDYLNFEDMDDQIVQALYDEKSLKEIAELRRLNSSDDVIFQIIQEELSPDLSFEENVESINKAIKDFRSGKTKFEIEFLEKVHDEPQVIVCDPKEDLVVPVDTTDINESRLIDHKFWKTVNEVKIAMRDEKFIKYGDSEVESWAKSPNPGTRYTRALRDGVSEYTQADLILLHETCVWYDINDDGIKERCIATWPDADPSSVLRFIELPYDHGMWPYVQVRRELNDVWFYSSRGIAALDDDFQTGISTKFNQDVDNQTIVNTPTIKARRNSVKNLRNLKYIPGQVIELDNIDDYQIEQHANASQGTFLTTAQYLKSWANERLGNVTSGLSQANNLPGAGEGGKKTAREIDTVTFLQSQVQSLDLIIFQQQMQKVYHQIDALYDQFGPDEEEILLTGEKPLKVSRREIQGKFNLVPNGRVDNSNPQLRAAKSFSLLRAFLNDPDIKQYELKKMYLDDIDMRVSKKLLYTQEEIQQRNAMIQQSQEQFKQNAIAEQLKLKTITDRIDLQKEAALATIQGRKYAPEE